MADTVDTLTLFESPHKIIRRFTNISDGTGESAVVKFDKSALVGPKLGEAPRKLIVEEIQWSIQGFTSVRIFWDAATDDEIAVLGTGSGYFNYGGAGGLVDPVSTTHVGDIIFTTAGTTSGNTYDITMVVRKHG